MSKTNHQSLKQKLLNIEQKIIPEKEGKRCKTCNSILQIISRQTRSADEGMTTFYNCLKCVKTYKIN